MEGAGRPTVGPTTAPSTGIRVIAANSLVSSASDVPLFVRAATALAESASALALSLQSMQRPANCGSGSSTLKSSEHDRQETAGFGTDASSLNGARTAAAAVGRSASLHSVDLGRIRWALGRLRHGSATRVERETTDGGQRGQARGVRRSGAERRAEGAERAEERSEVLRKRSRISENNEGQRRRKSERQQEAASQ